MQWELLLKKEENSAIDAVGQFANVRVKQIEMILREISELCSIILFIFIKH